jgi:hypothetical protein
MKTATVVLLFALAVPAAAEEFRYEFRGGDYRRLFRLENPKGEEFLTSEAEGLRWRYTADNSPTRAVGIYWRTAVHGDFVTTARYEVLHADRRPDGFRPGPELYLMLDTPARDGVVLAVQDTILFQHLTNNQAGKRYPKHLGRCPAGPASERGRLRLAREGATIFASVAAGNGDQVIEMGRADVGTADVRMVRFGALPGDEAAPNLDLRLREFVLTIKEPGQAGNVAAALQEARVAIGPVGRVWLVVALGVVIVLVLAALATLVAVKLRRRVPGRTPHAAAQPVIVIGCPHCGRTLKARAALAGKRVKCPDCDGAVAVTPCPAVAPSETAIRETKGR